MRFSLCLWFSSPQFLLFLCVYVSSVGYAGRTELPDNLKSMFRPISMVVPDSTLIAEITLLQRVLITARYADNSSYA